MNGWLEKLKALNEEWNGLPRKLLTILTVLATLFVLLLAFPFVMPFVLAALFAWMIDPVVRGITRLVGRKKLARKLAAAVSVVLLASVAIVLLLLLVGRVLEEVKTLAIALPEWIGVVSTDAVAWVDSLDYQWLEIEPAIEQALLRLLGDITSMLTSLASRMASTVARVAWQAAGFLPQGLLFIVLTLMGTFYMSADKERIFGFLIGLLPEKHRKRSSLFRASILRAVLGQVRAALIMLMVTFTELSFGFLLIGLDYAILLALAIAVLDALPVIGAGLFLIPMCVYGVATGNAALAIGGGVMYLITIVVRQLLEPRIIGKQLGLYPLATMMAMYAGLRLMGFLGMLLGPMMLMLCKVALVTEFGANGSEPRKAIVPWRERLRRGKKATGEGDAGALPQTPPKD